MVETGKVKSSNKHKRNMNIDYPFKFSDPLIVGGPQFIEEVEQRLDLRIEHRGQGRPSKTEESDDEAT